MAKSKTRVSVKEVTAWLHADDFAAGRQRGSAVLPALEKIVHADDGNLAAKAAFLAGLINDEGSTNVIVVAAKSRKTAVRVAAAAAAAHLSPERAEPILMRLLKSKDVGLRKVAIEASQKSMTGKLRDKVKQIQQEDTHTPLRSIAKRALKPLEK